MADIDKFATSLLETAKAFLEKAAESEGEIGEAYLTAALLTGVSALEAHVNAVAEEVSDRPGVAVHERGLLLEREMRLEKGEFRVTTSLKMWRMEDRLEFLFNRFGKGMSARNENWWSALQNALDLRNKVVHPKESPTLTKKGVENALNAVLDCLNALYKAVFKKGLPGYNRGLHSALNL